MFSATGFQSGSQKEIARLMACLLLSSMWNETKRTHKPVREKAKWRSNSLFLNRFELVALFVTKWCFGRLWRVHQRKSTTKCFVLDWGFGSEAHFHWKLFGIFVIFRLSSLKCEKLFFTQLVIANYALECRPGWEPNGRALFSHFRLNRDDNRREIPNIIAFSRRNSFGRIEKIFAKREIVEIWENYEKFVQSVKVGAKYGGAVWTWRYENRTNEPQRTELKSYET